MQYPYKQRSPPSGQQYDSFVDMDGFPSASIASSAPSYHNNNNNNDTNDNMEFSITRNNNNVRKLEHWGADSTAIASSSARTSQNHDRIAAALFVATNRQPPPKQQPARDQQIFRRPGVGTSFSRSFDSSNNSRGRSNEQNTFRFYCIISSFIS